MEKPLVTILMAIFKPNINWLVDQLLSLNNQTYENINLLVWNDCPEDSTDYDSILKKYITRFPFKIYRGGENLGSNRVFSELTKLAQSEYICYCDQDDIWLPDKVSVLVDYIHKNNVDLVCSDMYVIDKNGQVIADSIAVVRPRQLSSSTGNVFLNLLVRNFVTGCTILTKTSFAKTTIPFPDFYFHDWWLAICAAGKDSLGFIKKPLIKYRIHSQNQSGILKGVFDKNSYFEKRINRDLQRASFLVKYGGILSKKREISIYYNYVNARYSYYNNKTILNLIRVCKCARLDYRTVAFEVLILSLPDCLIKYFIDIMLKKS